MINSYVIKNKEIEKSYDNKLVDQYIRSTIINRLMNKKKCKDTMKERKYSSDEWEF